MKPALLEAMEYLASFTNYERRLPASYNRELLDPTRMLGLLAAVGNPQDRFPSIHVTGSKGKGTVSHLSAAILREAGFKVGLYTSPHLIRITERIRVDDMEVDDEVLAGAVDRLRPHLDKAAALGRPHTFFDAITAAAFVVFADAHVDAAIVEVGMGGRLDSTSVVRSEACVLTNVLSDHADILGPQPTRIAREKAAIFRPDVPALVGPVRGRVLAEVRRLAHGLGAPLHLLERDFPPARIRSDAAGSLFCLAFQALDYGRLGIPLLGEHQVPNAALAVAATQAFLGEVGKTTDPECARRALAKTHVPGRLELRGSGPRLLVDAAHSPESAQALAQVVRQLGARKVTLVCAVLEDRGPDRVLPPMLGFADRVLATRANSPRAAGRESMERAAGRALEWFDEPVEAVQAALADAGAQDLVVVSGSFYLAGQLLGALEAGRISV